jgi:hypothetical protein
MMSVRCAGAPAPAPVDDERALLRPVDAGPSPGADTFLLPSRDDDDDDDKWILFVNGRFLIEETPPVGGFPTIRFEDGL